MFKDTGDQHIYNKFSLLRRKVKDKVIHCYLKYVHAIEEGLLVHMKEFWSYTKQLRKTNTYPKSIKFNNKVASTNKGIAETFKEFFQSVYRSSNNRNQHVKRNKVNSSLPPFQISENDILKIITGLDGDKGPGFDGIPNLFIINADSALLKPLSIIFNKSLQTGVFPQRFKESIIHPIHKNGDKGDATNYRPVTILNAFAKILERLIHQALLSHVQPYLNHHQHGFLPRRSTVSNLLEYTTWLSTNLDLKQQIDVIYLDFSKAFDAVSHNLIVEKLRDFGVSGALIPWFNSYLRDRPVRVVFNGDNSSTFFPTSGVPQGSILGPLLFVLYIDELPEIIESYSVGFADDFKIGRVVNNREDCEALQRDINNVFNWSEENDLTLNTTKTNSVTITNKTVHNIKYNYSLNNTVINTKPSQNDLGVTIDTILKYNLHIESIINKAFKSLGFVIRTTKPFRDIESIIKLYKTLVLPHLEYASVIWNPFQKNHIDSLEAVQRRFTRYLWRKFGNQYTDYDSRLKHLKLLSLRKRRVVADQMLLYNILHGYVAVDAGSLGIGVKCGRTTRSAELFAEKTWNINSTFSATIPRILRFHNRYLTDVVDIFAASKHKYKADLIGIMTNFPDALL